MIEYLCKDLKLTIQKEPLPHEFNREQIRACLRDELTLNEVYVCYPINETSVLSRKYHLREAVILSVRRVLGEAFKEGLISEGTTSNSPGVSISLSMPLDVAE